MTGRALGALLCTLLSAAPIGAQSASVLRIGAAAGGGGVDLRGRAGSWDYGPMFGARLLWQGRRSGLAAALDVQPFEAHAPAPHGAFRALYLTPSWQVHAGSAHFGVGIGLGALRFAAADASGDRIDVTTLTGVMGSVRLPGSFALELSWRRTGLVRGFRSNVWALQLTRLWRVGRER